MAAAFHQKFLKAVATFLARDETSYVTGTDMLAACGHRRSML
ncbi:hypothetical protein [Agrobacterium rubi]|nr:hypothetical protein [Agrobacterium rubi]